MNAAHHDIEGFPPAAVVVGSGFGGTIAAWQVANRFAKRNLGEKVLLLERGQWWISHELEYRSPKERTQEEKMPTIDPNTQEPEEIKKLQKMKDLVRKNMREFLHDAGEPYGFWAHPDNVEGIVDLTSKARLISKTGLYDYTQLSDKIHVITASGVGGGSLIYSNVTLEPPVSVYQDWATEKPSSILQRLKPYYFDKARNFIGVNKITTVSGLGLKNTKLEKLQLFQQAARNVAEHDHSIINYDPNDPDFGFASDLSITEASTSDIMDEIETNIPPLVSSGLTQKSIANAVPQLGQQNVCQRQGRCNLGCLPGARHTLNKKIVSILQDPTLKDFLEVRALSEVQLIEFVEPDQYKVHYVEYDRTTGAVVGRKVVQTKMLVVAAGTLGTNELLFKSRGNGLRLSKKLGHCFSPNGDLLGFMQLSDAKPNQTKTFLDITRGPINACHAEFKGSSAKHKDFAFTIEDTTLSKMVAPFFATLFDLYVEYMESKRNDWSAWTRLKRRLKIIERYQSLGLLVVLFGLDISKLQGYLTRITSNFTSKMSKEIIRPKDSQPALLLKLKGDFEELMDWFMKDHGNPAATPEERLSRYFVFSAMGLDKADGVLDFPNGELKLKDDGAGPKWFERNQETFTAIIKGMEKLAKEIDPESDTVYAPTWNSKSPNESSLVVLHPLGGASMGESAEEGVVNGFGQVFRDDPSDGTKVYDKFYIMDGSIVPTALGVNSSLTIAALAFRCSDHLLTWIPDPAKGPGGPTP